MAVINAAAGRGEARGARARRCFLPCCAWATVGRLRGKITLRWCDRMRRWRVREAGMSSRRPALRGAQRGAANSFQLGDPASRRAAACPRALPDRDAGAPSPCCRALRRCWRRRRPAAGPAAAAGTRRRRAAGRHGAAATRAACGASAGGRRCDRGRPPATAGGSRPSGSSGRRQPRPRSGRSCRRRPSCGGRRGRGV